MIFGNTVPFVNTNCNKTHQSKPNQTLFLTNSETIFDVAGWIGIYVVGFCGGRGTVEPREKTSERGNTEIHEQFYLAQRSVKKLLICKHECKVYCCEVMIQCISLIHLITLREKNNLLTNIIKNPIIFSWQQQSKDLNICLSQAIFLWNPWLLGN